MNELCYEKAVDHAGNKQILVFVHSRKDRVFMQVQLDTCCSVSTKKLNHPCWTDILIENQNLNFYDCEYDQAFIRSCIVMLFHFLPLLFLPKACKITPYS